MLVLHGQFDHTSHFYNSTGLCLESTDNHPLRMCDSHLYSDIGAPAVLTKDGCDWLIGIGYHIYPGDKCGDNPQGPGKYLDVREGEILRWIMNIAGIF